MATSNNRNPHVCRAGMGAEGSWQTCYQHLLNNPVFRKPPKSCFPISLLISNTAAPSVGLVPNSCFFPSSCPEMLIKHYCAREIWLKCARLRQVPGRERRPTHDEYVFLHVLWVSASEVLTVAFETLLLIMILQLTSHDCSGRISSTEPKLWLWNIFLFFSFSPPL